MTTSGPYAPSVRTRALIFVSNTDSEREGTANWCEPVSEANIAQARDAARRCALNIADEVYAQTRREERVKAILQLRCAICAVDAFDRYLEIADLCRDTLAECLDVGRAACVTVYGAVRLPGDSTIEAEAVIALEEQT